MGFLGILPLKENEHPNSALTLWAVFLLQLFPIFPWFPSYFFFGQYLCSLPAKGSLNDRRVAPYSKSCTWLTSYGKHRLLTLLCGLRFRLFLWNFSGGSQIPDVYILQTLVDKHSVLPAVPCLIHSVALKWGRGTFPPYLKSGG